MPPPITPPISMSARLSHGLRRLCRLLALSLVYMLVAGSSLVASFAALVIGAMCREIMDWDVLILMTTGILAISTALCYLGHRALKSRVFHITTSAPIAAFLLSGVVFAWFDGQSAHRSTAERVAYALVLGFPVIAMYWKSIMSFLVVPVDPASNNE